MLVTIACGMTNGEWSTWTARLRVLLEGTYGYEVQELREGCGQLAGHITRGKVRPANAYYIGGSFRELEAGGFEINEAHANRLEAVNQPILYGTGIQGPILNEEIIELLNGQWEGLSTHFKMNNVSIVAAKIAHVLRRLSQQQSRRKKEEITTLEKGGVKLDRIARRLWVLGEERKLRDRPLKKLETLMLEPKRLFHNDTTTGVIRKALGELGKYIVTISGRGVCFDPTQVGVNQNENK